ncbi:MAG: GDYXXLXY domain-containing protein [Rhodobacterales bacterium]|nr:GDYXXLXY domain-containing protein [Rhodobacterales bacterium]MDX5390115.1 GDYXXLXY domain-containing protein [Rhodobacterales bacterium]MDX5489806.1 GDYXXLXY domain-containing protein [Rhodobacterales bacterium]
MSKARPLTRRWLVAAIITVALVQTAALAKMVTDRAALLRDGTEVVLETGAIDPRDLFRGHYTILNLSITRIDPARVKVDPQLEPGMPVYVVLGPGPDGYWQAENLLAAPPDSPVPVLRGVFEYALDSEIILSFPIDRYFAPKDRALELEGINRDGRMGVILALDRAGYGAIKGLMIDGQRIYDEALF